MGAWNRRHDSAAVIAITLGLVALCVTIDLRRRRIPNALSGLGLLAGLALNAWYFGNHGLGARGAGFAVAIAVLLVPFALGGIGGVPLGLGTLAALAASLSVGR